MLSVHDLGAVLGGGFSLQAISFAVAPGERLAILGPNGSGKSTVLRLIAGLDVPTAGTIAWRDTLLSEAGRVVVAPERRGVGMVFQEGVLFPHLNARRNVALGLPPGTDRASVDRRVDDVLEALQIEHLADRPVPKMSAGQQQRVALARALVQEPRVLLLDEPLHSLDPPLRRALVPELRAIAAREAMATILVTNDVDEAAGFADRIMLLRDGRAVRTDTMEELYRRPADAWVAGFLGDVQCLDAARARAFGIALPDGVRGRFCFWPEDLVLSPSPDAGVEGLRITDIRASVGRRKLIAALPDGTTLISLAPMSESPAQGQTVLARIERILAIDEDEDTQP